MYCKRCMSELPKEPIGSENHLEPAGNHLDYATRHGYACSRCGRPFNPSNPKTYLASQFPTPKDIVGTVILTTMIGTIFAGVVALHQLNAMSGH